MNVPLVLVLLFALHRTADCFSKNGKKTCSLLTTVTQNIPQTFLLKNPTAGLDLKICQNNLTCCSKQMENELYKKSSRVLKDAVGQQTNATHYFLKTQASLFDGYFTNLFKTARVRWHKMLLLTYKEIYVRNRHIFDNFFTALDDYYKNGDVDLDQSFNLFFQKIQNTMFTLINKRLAELPGFLNCTTKHIADIQPFGKYQTQITKQLKSTLVYARKLIVGLQAGSNVTASIMSYMSRNECREGFTKIQHCSLCEGIPNALVCNATCHNVLHSCFLLDPNFDAYTYWSDYIRGLHALSSGLDGQYDIEAVVGQLGYDISSAIMEFQSNFVSVLAKAKSLCSTESRRKRAIDESGSDLYLEGERVKRSQDSVISLAASKQQQSLSLDTHTTAFRKGLIEIKDVWQNFPQKFCSGQTFVSRDENATCWNGMEMQKNSDKVPSHTVKVVDVESRRTSIVRQLMKLKLIVEIVENDSGGSDDTDDASGEPDYSGSSSGSGWDESGILGSGDQTFLGPDPRTTVAVVIPRKPATTTDPGSASPSFSTTDQTKVISTTDRSTSTTDESILVDVTEASGTPPTEYVTTPKSLINEPIIDDEDLEISGSGDDSDTMADETPKTSNEISRTTTEEPIVYVKGIRGTKGVDRGSGSMLSMSCFSILLVTLVCFIMNM